MPKNSFQGHIQARGRKRALILKSLHAPETGPQNHFLLHSWSSFCKEIKSVM